MTSHRLFDIAAMDDAAVYRLLAALVVPRPIALVSTVSPAGIANLAPFSFFTVASAAPPVMSLSVGRRYGSEAKDTIRNIEATREFVINVVDGDIAREMNATSLDLSDEVDEFELTGLEPRPARYVAPRRVARSPAQFECRLLDTFVLGTWTLVLGSVVAAHVSETLIGENEKIDCRRIGAIGRLAGELYCRTDNWFIIPREADRPDLR